jgi:uncharacterized SAM-binding protein YcdF (DUF218 family)
MRKFLISADSDALVLQDAALVLGIDQSRIAIENKAKDTAEQAIEIKRLVKNDRIVLVTSAIHMPRAMALFTKQGIDCVSAPTDFFIRRTNLRGRHRGGDSNFILHQQAARNPTLRS